MNWAEVIEHIFELLIYPLVSALGIYLVQFISAKIKEVKQKSNDEITRKYLDMLDITVASAVTATTQTYVESLKQQGKFDAEAQKAAFKQTYDAVMAMMTTEASKYLSEVVGDLEVYIKAKIESAIKLSK